LTQNDTGEPPLQNGTKIAVEPYRKLVIRTYLKYDSPEKMAKELAKGATGPIPIVLRWDDGVLFYFWSYPVTDFVSQKLVEGILIWDHLDFALMKEFKDKIDVEGSPAQVVVRDVRGHPLFDQLARFVKEQLVNG